MYHFTGRVPTIISPYDFARHVGLHLFSFFGLTVKNCPGLANTYTDTCAELWVETSQQGASRPNRADLTKSLAAAERAVADYVGYWPGPHYEENERHFMTNWDTVISTRYMKVVKTGQRVRELVLEADLTQTVSAIPLTRSFLNAFDQLAPDVVRYRFGSVASPIDFLPDNCHLLFYPRSATMADQQSGVLDEQKTINEAWRLRPHIDVERDNTFLTVDFPLPSGVRPEKYFVYPDIKGNVRFLDACDPDNFVDTLSVYSETFEKPDGYVKIAKDLCPSCSGTGCEACDLPELPICLVPISSEYGKFRVRPIRNTGTDENPCWIIDDVESCCGALGGQLESGRSFDNRWACDIFCTHPLELCIDYVSSCNDCFDPDCFDRQVCPDLLGAIAKVALANVSVYCDCTCWREIIGNYREEWPMRIKGASRSMVDENQYELGIRVGQVEAWLDLKHVEGRHRSVGLGMVG